MWGGEYSHRRGRVWGEGNIVIEEEGCGGRGRVLVMFVSQGMNWIPGAIGGGGWLVGEWVSKWFGEWVHQLVDE